MELVSFDGSFSGLYTGNDIDDPVALDPVPEERVSRGHSHEATVLGVVLGNAIEVRLESLIDVMPWRAVMCSSAVEPFA